MKTPLISLNKSVITFLTVAFFITVSAASTTGIYAQRLSLPKNPAPAVQRMERATAELKTRETIADADRAVDPAGETDLISAAAYPFTNLTGIALDDMSTGTTQLVAASQDDTASAVTNIGFDFWYDGVRYTQFSANANGLARLGATAVTTSFDNTTFSSTTNAPKIAPYFDDLCTGSNGKVHYKVTGTAPNRKLTVEFLNMQISRSAGCSGVGNGTFQLWIYESAAATNPGLIQFVYGALPVPDVATDGGYSVGLQSGAATNFASVTTSSNSVSYAAANNANGTAITAGTSYLFTPNVPAAPSGLTFTPVGITSQTLNWTDNSSNEVGFAIYRSTDNVNYSFIGQTAANATSYADSGLNQSTNYFYRVYAVTEGALSAPLSGNQATAAGGNDTCNGAGGLWSAPTTWLDGSVPTATDNVMINAGCTVTIDIASNALTLNVQNNGVLQYETTTARTLTVVSFVTIDAGGTFQSAATGTVTTHVLSVGTDLTNNGTLDFSTNANTAGAGITFIGATNNTFSGTGATTDIRAITINKGTTNANILELSTSNFTVQGVTTDVAGFLTLTNGTFKLSGTFTVTNRVFAAVAYTIGTTTGFWLNNPNFTVAGQNGTGTVTGLFRVSQGTYNVGTATGNSLSLSTGANVTVEGGAINSTGRFAVSAAAQVITYNQTGGTITVCTIGNASTTLGSFDLGTGTGSSINWTGGTVVTQLAATTIDYRNQAGGGITGVTNGTLQLGNANSGAAKTFNIRGVVPNLVISNDSAGHTAAWSTTLVNYNNISRNITINTGTTLNLGNVLFLFYGTTLTNNGTLTHTGASSNTIIFTDYAPVTYTGTGTVTAPLSNLSFQQTSSFTVDPASPNIVTAAVRLFTGSVINANKITVGNGGATSAIIQIGNTTTPTAAGTFDQPLTFNPGTAGVILSYLRTTASRTTGGEIPPSRSITTFAYDDNDTTHTLTLAGGDLTVTGVSTLTNGRIVTGANNFIVGSAGSVTRTAGYIDGNLNKTFTAAASKTFEVGTLSGYSPAAINATAGTFPSAVTVKATPTTLQGLDSTNSVNRYWTITGSGLTADLSFTYLATDVNGTESTYQVYKRESGVTTLVGGSTNTATHTATVTGVTSFSDWGVGNALGPTAAQVVVGGRVMKSNGGALGNARLTLTDSHGVSRSVMTSPSGSYHFDGVNSGETYVIGIVAKGYSFNQPVQALTVNESLTELNFIAR